MRNLIPPTLDAEDVLRKTVAAKRDPDHRKRLRALLPIVLSCYKDWAADPTEALESLVAFKFTARQAADLLHCYKNPTAPLNALSRHIRDVQVSGIRRKCHYCGLDAPNRNDHYFPKESFPEFVIHPMNLLPACAVCNEKKGKVLRDKAGVRVVGHLYLDRIPTVAFLCARIVHIDGDPVAEFQLDVDAIPETSRRLVNSHVQRLGLLERYAEAANDVIDEVRSWLNEYANGQSIAQAAEDLRREAARRARAYGPNQWERVLLHALADDDVFMKSCLPAAD